MSPPKIRAATSEEREQVLATIVLGFSSDPLVRWMWSDPAAYAQSAEGFDAFGGKAVDNNTAFIADEFHGAALWLPPGTKSDEEAFAAFSQRVADPEKMADMMGLFEAMAEYHPEGDIWYLPIIGVDPIHQGRGVGAALMKHALALCDADGLPAYLESSNPRNISLYERHGFEVIGEIRIGAAPVVTPMLRPARTG